jgi:hypothetical protein
MRSMQFTRDALPVSCGSGAKFRKLRSRAGDATGPTAETGAQLFGANGDCVPVVGARCAAMLTGETERLELAVDRAGAKAHGGLPLKVSLPLSERNIAVQHGFGNDHGCDPALHFLHG